MHRHGYRGRKFGRERDQRNALMRGLACSLITHQSIKTTTPKAKELRPFVEKLVTAAKKGDLANRRLVRPTLTAAAMA
jgi:large subunit ribosomal protein L17